ncbi:MAG: tetratricopeptide repeat protein [Bacteroidales bacterium]|jgi:tetratricopeptide (TPR) repeat protein|nr:tetratricopeptide repeat protein [Bacteroidales bacterium]MDD2571015.1 tetratricopeptide repeat protein [Bacteroidales bacterium]MDD2813098.1 tetratricopeptide repeat protein [Bacteroidales bacterium]MDD3384501.1 tetratricopeptide repeat protein [Bacteroidales bacterium]MDD3812234.1 tetratricopeptide repeat protein [Bacteroidales bacterium]
MAILRVLFLILTLLAPFTAPSVAQSFDKQRAAFRNSYTRENSGDYQGAVNTLKGVYDQSSYEINLRLGWLSYKSGDFKESEGYYRRAINLRPYGVEPRLGLIYPLSSMGNWDQVIATYEEILKIDPNNSIANYRFGLVAYGREDYLKADQLFTKVLNLYPFDYDTLIILAWTRLKLGKSLEAKVLFQKALLYSPDDPSALEGLSLIK